MFQKHKSHISGSLIVIAIICSKSAFCQGYVSWYDTKDRGIHRISVLTGNHDVFYENNIASLPKLDCEYSQDKLRLPAKGHHFAFRDKLIVAFGGCGSVFSLDTNLGKIIRLDNTVHTGYNFDAYQFIRKDTVYSFGGYGFWTENNLLTYFSLLRKEWNVYSVGNFPPYNPDFETAPTYKFSFYDEREDALFVLRQNAFYKYSFENGQWERLGDLALSNTFPEKGTFGISNLHKLNDSTVMMMGGLKAYYVVPRNNVIYDVTLPNGKNANAATKTNPFGFHCGYDLKNELLLAKFSDKVENGYLFEYVNRLPKRINSESKLYTTQLITAEGKFGITVILIAITGLFLIIWLRKSYSKRRYQYFTEAQWKFIQLLNRGGMETDDLNDFLALQDSSWEVQRRKRSEYIKMINELSMNQLGCELVLRKRSKEDKRHILYVMNLEAKSKLARLM